MPEEPRRDNLDFERLSSYLKALANPNRLELLWLLRIPTPVAEVHLTPKRRDGGLQPERAMSRQAVQEHVDSLEAVGVVERLPDEGGRADLRVVHQARLFALLEELRSLTAIRPAVRVDVNATMDMAEGATPEWPAGPKFVLVSGPWEGRAFPLAGKGPWSLGRSRDRDVALTFDPYVSAEHATVERAEGTFFLRPAEGTRNPCRVNFAGASGRRPLVAGDVVGVGRSLLVFQQA